MLDEFKSDLNRLDSLQIYYKYILGAGCFLLDKDKEYQLKQEICEKFKVEFTDIVLVGSGKLGFSIKPTRRFQCFNDESDIDVAIVSKELFEQVWQESFMYKKSEADWPSSRKFFKYLSEGWIRPDKLPPSHYFKFSSGWWKFFNGLTASNNYGDYKIRAGLYYSHFFLKQYQSICIEQCIQENY